MCECTDWSNTPTADKPTQQHDTGTLFEASIEEIVPEGKTGVDNTMNWVFGDYALYKEFEHKDEELGN